VAVAGTSGCGRGEEVRTETKTETETVVQTAPDTVPEGGRLGRGDTLAMHTANVTVSQHCLSKTVPERGLPPAP
jgi:hypothetical protein